MGSGDLPGTSPGRAALVNMQVSANTRTAHRALRVSLLSLQQTRMTSPWWCCRGSCGGSSDISIQVWSSRTPWVLRRRYLLGRPRSARPRGSPSPTRCPCAHPPATRRRRLNRGEPAEHDCGGWLDRPARVGADYQILYRELGADMVAATTRDSIHDAEHGTLPSFAANAGGTADRPA